MKGGFREDRMMWHLHWGPFPEIVGDSFHPTQKQKPL